MFQDIIPNIQQFATLASVTVAWVTVVRWTRDSKEEVKRALKRQFWIEHSVDLRYGVGTGPEVTHGDKKLEIKGLEIYDFGWWHDPINPESRPYNSEDKLREFETRLKLLLGRIGYGLYRNFRPGADLKMNCSLLIEPKNCQISNWESIESGEWGTKYSGKQLTQEIPEIRTFSRDIQRQGLCKIGLSTYLWYDADGVIRQLASSDFIKEADVEVL